MDSPGLTIYNLPPMPPKWDRVGVFYVSFAATWTAVVLAGMAFCWYNRHLPILRVRGLPLAFGSIFFLHLYWIMAQIVYPIGRTLPVVIAYDVQYFVMGIWLPLGIALFHASNLRFLHVAKLQRQFTHPALDRKRGCDGARTSWLCRVRNMDYTHKVMMFITTGMLAQILLCIGMWLACEKYHPTFGIPGTQIKGTTLIQQLIELGRGWEWWPSVMWQFIWSWGVAPILIWRAWGIRDTMGWRIQTVGACLSGLHATPMFLIASYVPAFYKINAYFPPSQWIHLNTLFITIFTVFVPAYQVIKLWIMTKHVSANNSKWETQSQTTIVRVGTSHGGKSYIHDIEKEQIFEDVSDSFGDRLLTMGALNRVLQEHPAPLQEFSACNDFSGENIAFLTRVAQWKASLQAALKKNKATALEGEERIDCFNAALKIYVDFVSPQDAEFPLNLSCQELRMLESVFEKPARVLYGDARQDSVSPFMFDGPPPSSHSSRHSGESRSTGTTLQAKYTGDISPLFGLEVFDETEKHVKYLVLMNTWPKFVREMQMRRRKSVDSERSGMTDSSEATIASQITRFVKWLK